MFNPFFRPMCLRFEGEDDLDGGGGGGYEPLDSEGNFTEDFYNSFDEDDRATISRYKNPKELGKGHMSLRRTFDKPVDRLVVLPDENSTEEEVAAFRQKMGVPQEASGYEFTLNPELNKVEMDDNRLNAFREIAKKHEIPKSKFNGIVNDYLALVNKDAVDFELVQAKREQDELDEDNKIADKYFGQSKEERIARADMLLRKFGNVEIKDEKGEVIANAIDKLIEKHPDLKHSPWLAIVADNIAEAMHEDRIKGLTGVTTPTNAAIKQKVKELRDNPAYYDASHPDHERITKEVMELYKKMSA